MTTLGTFGGGGSSRPEEDKNDWKVQTAANGLPFYYNIKVTHKRSIKSLFHIFRQKSHNGTNLNVSKQTKRS